MFETMIKAYGPEEPGVELLDSILLAKGIGMVHQGRMESKFHKEAGELQKKTQDTMEWFRHEITALEEIVKHKTFDAAAFADLRVVGKTVKNDVLSDGILHFNEIVSAIHEAGDRLLRTDMDFHAFGFGLAFSRSIKAASLAVSDSFRNRAYSLAHSKTFSWMNGGGSSHHLRFTLNQDPSNYVIDGTRISSAGYAPDYVTKLISESDTILNGVSLVISQENVLDDFLKRFDQISFGILMKLAQKESFRNSLTETMSQLIISAMRVVSDYYMREAIYTANFIAKHCYK